ncbi:hypothetical protein Cni_G08899 [Canna indica]|uniref:DUF4378 domain-containing protein n=1 Tax=Canna indica TaxID=4628 RepID=A0AAQ3Q630_9LILI|nr:hypothetical protein Cni_G08899 [Canna indica]
MTKKSRRRPAQFQRENFRFIRGLISFFDFRQGRHIQKPLADKKIESTRYEGAGYSRSKLDSLRSFHDKHGGNLVDEIKEDQVNLCPTSVKILMEEEISQRPKKKVASVKAKSVRSTVKNEVYQKDVSPNRSKNLSVISDGQLDNLMGSLSLDGHLSDSTDSTGSSLLKYDIAAFLIELYSYTCQGIHSDSNNKFSFLPTSGSIGPNIRNHLDELDDHLDQKISFFQRTLADVAQAIICEKSMAGNRQLNKQCVVHSKEFMDALDTLNSDKELFMKLLQDPNSLLLKHIQGLQCSQVGKLSKPQSDKCFENVWKLRKENDSKGKCKESDINHLCHKQNRYNFFRKGDKSKVTKPTSEHKSSEDSIKIVVLEPRSARNQNCPRTITPSTSLESQCFLKHGEQKEKNVSHFSLKNIKRRLRHIIGESKLARHVISMDGILHKIPVRSNESADTCKRISSKIVVANSASNPYCDTKQLSYDSLSINNSKFDVITEECKVRRKSHVSSSRSESFTYEKAKKHLAEMLDNRLDILPRAQISKSLERVISLPRYIELYPRSSSQKDKELTMLPEETENSSLQNLLQDKTDTLGPSRTTLEHSSCSLSTQNDELELLILNPESVDTSMQDKSCIGEDSTSEEFQGAVDTKSTVECNYFNVPLESIRNESPTVVNKMYEEERKCNILQGQVSSEESPQTVAQPRFEKPEQPSPVSVLETFISEDSTSPLSDIIIKIHGRVSYEDCNGYKTTLSSPYAKDKLTDCLHDAQARFAYIKAVMVASGLTDKFSGRWDATDQLLEPSLYDELEVFPQDDAKLLFDCISEVLVEMHEKYLKFTPRLSFIKQNVLSAPQGERLIQQVSKCVDQHLHIQLPNTLNQVIRKDLDNRSWMNLRRETEIVTSEMYESILDDLVDETIYDLWF